MTSNDRLEHETPPSADLSTDVQSAKQQSRGVSSDMSAAAVLHRLEIVDELVELANELQRAKRLGPLPG
jgi:hypothetical protein